MARTEAAFVRDEVIPLVKRRSRGAYDGDTTHPKWPDSIHLADGMKRLAAWQSTDERRLQARDQLLERA